MLGMLQLVGMNPCIYLAMQNGLPFSFSNESDDAQAERNCRTVQKTKDSVPNRGKLTLFEERTASLIRRAQRHLLQESESNLLPLAPFAWRAGIWLKPLCGRAKGLGSLLRI